MHIPAGFAQVNYIFQGGGSDREFEVTLGVDNTAAAASALALAETFKAQYAAHLQGVCNQNVTLDRVAVKLGPNDTGPAAESPAALVGTGGTGDFYPNVAALVKKVSNLGGRHGRGRSFWPLAGESEITNGGKLTLEYRGNLQEALDNFRDVFDDAEQELVILHSAALPIPTGITAFVVDPTVGTQRRRLRG